MSIKFSFIFEANITIISLSVLRESNSANNLHNVEPNSVDVEDTSTCCLALIIVSASSIKIIHGLLFLALVNRLSIIIEPDPTNILFISLPLVKI